MNRRGKRGEEEGEEEEKRREKVWNLLSFVWILVWKYEFLWISLDFVWKSRFLYEKIMDFSMECLEFVYGTLDGCLCFCMGKSNHKPIFDEFGSKRTLLSILVVFWIWVG